ncbi:MAG: response regulator, partial [Deltaproteobacteria bacterium]
MDDEPQVLEGLSDLLQRRFEVVTAASGLQGTEALASNGPFAVVVSDFAMPRMNGAEFLAHARLQAPDTVRMLLTGHASLEGAIAAVNDGGIFRFLVKPCAPDSLLRSLEDAVEQARIVTADRQLMERKIEGLCSHLLRVERLASLGTMAGAVGHELNNILSVFALSVGYIQESATRGEPPTEEDLESLEYVRGHLATHAKNLLRYGRVPKAADLEPHTDIRQAVADTVALLRSAGILKHAELDLQLPANETVIGLTRTEVEQVLVNFFKNAADALEDAKHRRGRIAVIVERSDDGRSVACTVRDNGNGIPASD